MDAAQKILQETFGYSDFRPPQAEIINSLIDGHDAFVLMPTGGGKSLCYQIPALARPGVGIVISPLIALMQDQVDALRELGIRADCLNSSMSLAHNQQVEQALLNGGLDLLYVAPERLTQPRMLALLQQAPLALFAIDEAHCVSQWGHDFRSDYLQLSLLHEQFPSVPRIALTATADERTQNEIIHRLQLEQAGIFVSGFDRPNIQYRISQKNNPRQQLLRFIQNEHPNDAGVVYCLSRKKVEDTAAWLSQQGFNALPYHAGLSAELRQLNQQRFLREEGVIVVATVAFGMGIDKPDVRFVAHLDMPKSLEAYYQETGRAGRDGLAANAWMVYGLEDVIKVKQMIGQSEGNDQFKRVEQRKLDVMLGLAETIQCRRQTLLDYFGETLNDPCGNCDNCLTPPETWDGTDAARKALSCVYRTGQRFGVVHLIDVLKGKDNDKVIHNDHHRLTVYGIGKELADTQWRSVFRQLIAAGYLNVDMEFGQLKLTEKCRKLLRGEENLPLRLDKKPEKIKTRRPAREDIRPEQQPLWEALRACRKQLADDHGVPPYVIFHDASLMDMLVRLPTDYESFAQVSGVGANKLEKYADDFMAVIREYG